MAGGDHGALMRKFDAFDRAGKRRSECLFSEGWPRPAQSSRHECREI